MVYTTDDIINSYQIRSFMPVNQATYTQADLVRIVNEEFYMQLIPDMISAREDYFLTSKRYEITANTNKYETPNRALGNALKDVFYVDTNNNKYPIARVNINDIPLLLGGNTYPGGFYMGGDCVVLVPTPQQTAGRLELWFYRRPNELVLTAECGRIVSIAEETPISTQVTYTVDADISTYTKVDIVAGTSPFVLLSESITVQGASNTTIVLNNSSVSGDGGTLLPEVGDWICLERTSPIPMIPEDWQPLLVLMTARVVWQSRGDVPGLDRLQAEIDAKRQSMFNYMNNRVEQKNEAIVNRSGLARSTGYGWATGWYG